MVKAILKKKYSDSYAYYSDYEIDKNIGNLISFLNDIGTSLGCDATIFKDKLIYEKTGFGTNLHHLYRENNIITLQYDYADDPNDYLEISVTELIKVIEQWEKLCSKQVEAILVAYENGIFNLEEQKN